MGHMPTMLAKGRLPDVEDALLAWMKSQKELGINLSDGEIGNKALALHITLGCSEVCGEKIRSSTWMERIRAKIAHQ